MKKWILLCGLCTLSFPALYAQHLDMQSSTDAGGPALFERVTRLEKKTDAFNLYLNMQGSFNVYFNNGNEEQTSFRVNQLRIEAKGNITDRIYYRYRQRLNRANMPNPWTTYPRRSIMQPSVFMLPINFPYLPENNVLHSEDSNST